MAELTHEYRRIIKEILDGKITSRQMLEDEKRKVSTTAGLNRFIRSSEILAQATDEERKKISKILKKKPTRTLSGVAVVAAMCAPSECPHGKCRYCPGGPDQDVPQSYTGKEPATRRAIQYEFHPYLQTTMRLNQLQSIGHPTDKVELIVMGGTLTAQLLDYQDWFVKNCLMAMNDIEKNKTEIKKLGDEEFCKKYLKKTKNFRYREEIQSENEKAKARCVGITFEPRPDWAKIEQIDNMLDFGVTRVELGVQNPNDEIYEKIERGHTVEDVAEATQQLKDSAFKIGYHLMPGINGDDLKGDLSAFRKVFTEDIFKPDMIKIYPLIVMQGTDYSKKYRQGEFEPITTPQAVKLIAQLKSTLPKWVRTMRIMRDIPSNIVEAGIKKTNLGQLVHEYMSENQISCSCIRCREVGRHLIEGTEPETKNIKLQRTDYNASQGKEIFLSFEDVKNDILVGFTRLRIPSNPHRIELKEKTALIRELHVYGPMMEIGEKPQYEWQHRGYGTELIREAERIANEEYSKSKMSIISGIGVRDYYRSLGYKQEGPYMSSKIS